MKTDKIKEKLEKILKELIWDADKVESFELKYCDIFTKKTYLELSISVNLSVDYDEKENLTTVYPNWVSVNRFDLVDESGQNALSDEKIAEIVEWVAIFVFNFYKNL